MNKKAEELIKQAGLGGRLGAILGKGIDAAWRGGARYGELLRGSSTTLLPYRLAQKLTRGFGSIGKKLGLVRPGETTRSRMQLAVSALKGEFGEPVAKELAKVYATRAGTGAAGVGLSGLALRSALSGDEQKAAEAAYAEGFCKAAEIAGVDPGALAKAAAGSSDYSTANSASEVAGFLSPAALDVLGRIALRRGRPGAAIAAGLACGVTRFGNLVGAVTGLAKDTRSNAAQAAYDSERHILKNLLPGVGGYNMWKRIGNKMRGE